MGQWTFDEKNFNGVNTYGNGDVYTGGWDMSKRSGHGKLVRYDGNNLEGTWINDGLIGKGPWTFEKDDKNGYVSYFGDHAFGYMHGDGKLKFKNGDIFIGKLSRNII